MKKNKTTKSTENDTSSFNINYMNELYIIEQELPGLLTTKQKKDLKTIKNGPEKLLKSLYDSRNQLIKAIYSQKLKLHRDLKEVQYLWTFGDPTQLIELVNKEVEWIEKSVDTTPGIPYWIDIEFIQTKINEPRYKSDPLGLGAYWLLLLTNKGKRKSSEVIKWWQDLYKLSKILSDEKYKENLEELKRAITQLVTIINKLFPPSKPWKFREKIDSRTLRIVKNHIYESLQNFIQDDYPNIEIKSGKANGIVYHRLDPNSKHYKGMLTAFFDKKGLPEKALTSLLEDNVVGSSSNNSSITLRNITNTIVETKYGISEKTNIRKSRKRS